MKKFKKIKHYIWGTKPELVPVDWENCPYSSADFENVLKQAGFDANNEENGCGVLTKNWEGHKKGSLIVSGLTMTGHNFSVLE